MVMASCSLFLCNILALAFRTMAEPLSRPARMRGDVRDPPVHLQYLRTDVMLTALHASRRSSCGAPCTGSASLGGQCLRLCDVSLVMYVLYLSGCHHGCKSTAIHPACAVLFPFVWHRTAPNRTPLLLLQEHSAHVWHHRSLQARWLCQHRDLRGLAHAPASWSGGGKEEGRRRPGEKQEGVSPAALAGAVQPAVQASNHRRRDRAGMLTLSPMEVGCAEGIRLGL